jgi:hypothetical protein
MSSSNLGKHSREKDFNNDEDRTADVKITSPHSLLASIEAVGEFESHKNAKSESDIGHPTPNSCLPSNPEGVGEPRGYEDSQPDLKITLSSSSQLASPEAAEEAESRNDQEADPKITASSSLLASLQGIDMPEHLVYIKSEPDDGRLTPSSSPPPKLSEEPSPRKLQKRVSATLHKSRLSPHPLLTVDRRLVSLEEITYQALISSGGSARLPRLLQMIWVPVYQRYAETQCSSCAFMYACQHPEVVRDYSKSLDFAFQNPH